MATWLTKINNGLKVFGAAMKESGRQADYRLVSIEQDEFENHTAVIQVINKSQAFRMKPEEILASDEMTAGFSPIDVRTLTYLGYLGINAPKYQILAKRLSKNSNCIQFSVRKKGSKKIEIKTAAEISGDDEIITGLHQKDAHEVGYTTANENTVNEEKQKADLLKSLAN